MSENLEELLNVGDDNEGDYDLGDDEEEALLDENYDVANQIQLPIANSENKTELEQDVLDLDDETELNDEDNDNLNSTVEEEERCRQDKFSSERVVPQQEQHVAKKKFRVIQDKQNFRGGFHRGKRGGIRGNFHNGQNRTGQYHQRNKVLINPHFKGNVHIRHNVSLAWDKNNGNGQNKKPVIHITPWAKQTNQNAPMYQQNPVQPDMYMNQQYPVPLQNSRLPVHQRLGISSTIYSQSIPDNQLSYIQNFQQPVYPQIITQNQSLPQNPMYNQIQYPNQYNNSNHFIQSAFNSNINNNNPMNIMNKPVNPQFENPWNINQNQQMQPPHFHSNQNYSDYSLQPQSQSQFLHTFNSNNINNPVPNIVNYPQNVPVVNNECVNVDIPYYEEQPKMQFQRIRRYSGGSPTKRKFDFKLDVKKKKRTFLSSNLHEVKTVDIDVVKVEEDEEMKAYRQKIEHQKVIREKLLRQKEERRKQAAKKLQAEEEYKSLLTPTDIAKKEIPVIMSNTIEPAVVPIPKPFKITPIARVNKNIVPIKTVDNPLMIKRVVSTKPILCENVSSGNSETETLNKDQLTSFLSNRKIFAKDKSLVDTSLVVVNNLATGTSEVKLRKLCQGVGDIQVRVVENNCKTYSLSN